MKKGQRKTTQTLLLIAMTVLTMLVSSSAWAYGATGRVTQIMNCNTSSSDRLTLAEITVSNGSKYWYIIASSSAPHTERNEEIALAAMLSGKTVNLNHNGSGQDYCGVQSRGNITGSGRWIRMME